MALTIGCLRTDDVDAEPTQLGTANLTQHSGAVASMCVQLTHVLGAMCELVQTAISPGPATKGLLKVQRRRGWMLVHMGYCEVWVVEDTWHKYGSYVYRLATIACIAVTVLLVSRGIACTCAALCGAHHSVCSSC